MSCVCLSFSFRNKRREQLCTAASPERSLICCDEVASHRNSPSVSSALGGLSGWGRVSHFDAVCSVRHRVRGGDTFASEGAGSFASSPTATVRTPPQSRPCRCCFSSEALTRGLGRLSFNTRVRLQALRQPVATPVAPLQLYLHVLGSDICLYQVGFATSLAARMQSQRGVWK